VFPVTVRSGFRAVQSQRRASPSRPKAAASGDELGCLRCGPAATRRLTVWFTDAAVATCKAEPRTTRGGQPRCSGLAIATALTLRSVFRLALRQTEGLIGSIIALLGLDLAVPDHTTLSRRAETLEVFRPRFEAGPVHLLVDSTGLKLWARASGCLRSTARRHGGLGASRILPWTPTPARSPRQF